MTLAKTLRVVCKPLEKSQMWSQISPKEKSPQSLTGVQAKVRGRKTPNHEKDIKMTEDRSTLKVVAVWQLFSIPVAY